MINYTNTFRKTYNIGSTNLLKQPIKITKNKYILNMMNLEIIKKFLHMTIL